MDKQENTQWNITFIKRLFTPGTNMRLKGPHVIIAHFPTLNAKINTYIAQTTGHTVFTQSKNFMYDICRINGKSQINKNFS